MAIAMFSMVVAQAQDKTDITKSLDCASKLQTLCDAYPAESGNAVVDAYGKALHDVSVAAIASNKKLAELYDAVKAAKNEKAKADVLEQVINYGLGIASEGVDAQNAIAQAQKAAAAANTDKAKAIIEFGNKVTPLLLEGNATKAKVVRETVRALNNK